MGDDDDSDFYITNSLDDNLFLRYHNNSFEDIACSQNMEVNDICWGAQWIDFDNDADVDLYVGTFALFSVTPNAFFVNNNSNFSQDNEVIDSNELSAYSSSCGDFNNDGFPDILLHTHEAGFSILRNQLDNKSWIKISLVGSVSNSFGVGATIRIYSEDMVQKRVVHVGEDYMGQDSFCEHFGLDNLTEIDSIVVSWPSGWTDTVLDPVLKTNFSITEGVSFNPEITVNGNLCSNELNYLSVTGEVILLYDWDDNSLYATRLIETSGTYSVFVTNPFGITALVDIALELNPPLVPLVNAINVTCSEEGDGFIHLYSISDVAIETIDWNNGSYFDETLFDLEPGDYTYVLTDSNGCVASDTVSISQPSPILTSLNITQPACYIEYGTAEINPTGGTGLLEVNWNGENPNQLVDGSYEVQVTDSSGCIALESFNINAPPLLSAELSIQDANDGANGSASLTIFGGTPPYTIQWSNSVIGPETDGLSQGIHVVFATDFNDCSWSESFSIIDLGIPEQDQGVKLISLGQNRFFIESSSNAKGMMLLDTNGKIIEQRDLFQTSFEVDLNPNSPGLYFILIGLVDGRTINFKIEKL